MAEKGKRSEQIYKKSCLNARDTSGWLHASCVFSCVP